MDPPAKSGRVKNVESLLRAPPSNLYHCIMRSPSFGCLLRSRLLLQISERGKAPGRRGILGRGLRGGGRGGRPFGARWLAPLRGGAGPGVHKNKHSTHTTHGHGSSHGATGSALARVRLRVGPWHIMLLKQRNTHGSSLSLPVHWNGRLGLGVPLSQCRY